MATTLFVDGDVGSDTNSGSSEGASLDASGTGAVTNGTSTVDLSADTPDLSGISAGMSIRLNGESEGNQSSDVYTILTVNDGADTITVSPTPSTSVSGITWAIGGATKTIQRAVSTSQVAAMSSVFIKNSVTYTETVTFPNFFGLNTEKFATFEGYSSTVGDDGLVIIDGEDSRAGCMVMGTTTNYLIVKNIRATRATGRGFGLINSDWITFLRCESDNHGDSGFNLDNVCQLIDCYAHDNVLHGFLINADTLIINCVAIDNGGHGFSVEGGSIWNCLSIGNDLNGIHKTTATEFSVIDCTIIGKNKTTDVGINFVAGNQVSVIGCIIYDCTTGISGGAVGWDGENKVSQNNCLFKNTTNYSNFATHEGEVLADPLFVDEATGDYSLSTTSPCRNSGKFIGVIRNFTNTFLGDRAYIGALPPTPASVVIDNKFSPGLYINGDLG